MACIRALVQEPFPSGAIELKGTEERYRIRVGAYRIIYEINPEANCILIHHVRHRRDVYRNL